MSLTILQSKLDKFKNKLTENEFNDIELLTSIYCFSSRFNLQNEVWEDENGILNTDCNVIAFYYMMGDLTVQVLV